MASGLNLTQDFGSSAPAYGSLVPGEVGGLFAASASGNPATVGLGIEAGVSNDATFG